MPSSFQWARSAKPACTQAQSRGAGSFTTLTAAANEEACLVQDHCLLAWVPEVPGMHPWHSFVRYNDHLLGSWGVPQIETGLLGVVHLSLKARSHPWASLQTGNLPLIAQSGKTFIKQSS